MPSRMSILYLTRTMGSSTNKAKLGQVRHLFWEINNFSIDGPHNADYGSCNLIRAVGYLDIFCHFSCPQQSSSDPLKLEPLQNLCDSSVKAYLWCWIKASRVQKKSQKTTAILISIIISKLDYHKLQSLPCNCYFHTNSI